MLRAIKWILDTVFRRGVEWVAETAFTRPEPFVGGTMVVTALGWIGQLRNIDPYVWTTLSISIGLWSFIPWTYVPWWQAKKNQKKLFIDRSGLEMIESLYADIGELQEWYLEKNRKIARSLRETSHLGPAKQKISFDQWNKKMDEIQEWSNTRFPKMGSIVTRIDLHFPEWRLLLLDVEVRMIAYFREISPTMQEDIDASEAGQLYMELMTNKSHSLNESVSEMREKIRERVKQLKQ